MGAEKEGEMHFLMENMYLKWDFMSSRVYFWSGLRNLASLFLFSELHLKLNCAWNKKSLKLLGVEIIGEWNFKFLIK